MSKFCLNKSSAVISFVVLIICTVSVTGLPPLLGTELDETPLPSTICSYDLNGDGMVKIADDSELLNVNSPSECESIGGTVIEPLPDGVRQEMEDLVAQAQSADELVAQLSALNGSSSSGSSDSNASISSDSSSGNSFSSTSESASSMSSEAPSSSSSSSSDIDSGSSCSTSSSASPDSTVNAVNGRFSGQPAGGPLPLADRQMIRSKIAPALEGKKFNNSPDPAIHFDCQDFSEVAENAYRALTFTGVQCIVFCDRQGLTAGAMNKVQALEHFSHAVVDFHKDGKVYFLEPGSYQDKALQQYIFDLNKNGKMDAWEAGELKSADPGLQAAASKSCKGTTYVACVVWSYDDRHKAFDDKAQTAGKVRAPKLPR